jgi:hypothetical protein
MPDGAAAPLPPEPTSSGTAVTDHVTVNLRESEGETNEALLGWVWNSGPSIEPLAELEPELIRLDASLQSNSRGPDDLDLSGVQDRVADVRAVGAEPLILLSYTPRWLGEPVADGRDPSRVAPYDMDLWEAVVEDAVRTLATADEPAYRFEVWNEPDIFVFWDDTPEAFAEMALRTHRAVAAVAEETGLPLEVGGPALAFAAGSISGPFPDILTPYVGGLVDEGLPLDFISFHHYANAPYLGPDGNEGFLDDDLYEALARRNLQMSPSDYAEEIELVRGRVDELIDGTDLAPTYMLNEWNVSGGGYDLWNDRPEGAALVAGVLIVMEEVGLDEAAFYRAITGGASRAGDWGMVTQDGTFKPSWWVFRAWRAMEGERLATTGDDAGTGLWTRATRDRRSGCISVLLVNFVADGSPTRTVNLTLDGGLPACPNTRVTTVATLDEQSTTLAEPQPVEMERGDVTLVMEPQSVSLLRTSCARGGVRPGEHEEGVVTKRIEQFTSELFADQLIDAGFEFTHIVRVDQDLMSVMVAHLHVPSLDKEPNKATTLSHKVVTKMLKKDMNFNGLIFTDALNMKGVSSFHKPGEVDLLALMAGNDILLYSEDVPKEKQLIIQAVADGKISQEDIDARIKKVLKAKYWSGLHKQKPIDTNRLVERINTNYTKSIIEELYASSITVVTNENRFLPLKNLDMLNMASLTLGGDTARAADEIAKLARNQGMRTLREDGLAKVVQGDTTLEEIARVIV